MVSDGFQPLRVIWPWAAKVHTAGVIEDRYTLLSQLVDLVLVEVHLHRSGVFDEGRTAIHFCECNRIGLNAKAQTGAHA